MWDLCYKITVWGSFQYKINQKELILWEQNNLLMNEYLIAQFTLSSLGLTKSSLYSYFKALATEFVGVKVSILNKCLENDQIDLESEAKWVYFRISLNSILIFLILHSEIDAILNVSLHGFGQSLYFEVSFD